MFDGAIRRSPTTSGSEPTASVSMSRFFVGTEDDVRFYVEVGELVELFDELVLPPTVRRAWADWLLRHRGVVVAC